MDGQPWRGETCMKCRAEPVLEKHIGIFRKFFEFARRI